jgi:hypothetical protein
MRLATWMTQVTIEEGNSSPGKEMFYEIVIG